MNRRRNLVLLAGLIAVVVASGSLVFQPSAEARRAPQPNAELELIVALSPDPARWPKGVRPTLDGIASSILSSDSFQVDSFFDVYYVSNIGSSGLDGVRLVISNIGSSGQDGVRLASTNDPQFDSFFDITYDPVGTIEIEIVALQLRGTAPDPSNPAGALEGVKTAVTAAGGDVWHGHVTILK